MNTTVDALKALYIAFGGSADDVADLTVIPDVIMAIANLGSVKATSAMSVDNSGNLSITSDKNITIETTGSDNDYGVILKKGNSTLNVGEADNIYISSNSELEMRSGDGIYMYSGDEVIISANAAFSISGASDSSITTSDGAKLTIQPTGVLDLKSAKPINIIASGTDMDGYIIINSNNSGVSVSGLARASLVSGTNGVTVFGGQDRLDIDANNIQMTAMTSATLNNKAIATTS